MWTESYTERIYTGDVNQFARRLENGTGINDNVTLSNTFSIIADAYAYQNIFAMRYIEWMGTKWKVSNVSVERPRLNITVGGIFNA